METTTTEPGASRLPAAEAGRKARPVRAGARGGRLRGLVTIALFLLPGLVLFCLLVVAPILVAFYTSTFKWSGLGGPPTEFVGLDNFTRLFANEVFLGDLWHGAVLIALSVVVQLPLALGIALLLNQRLRGRAFYRLVFFAPYILSEAITAVLFTMILSPDQGLANQILGFFGLDGLEWFADQSTVLIALFLVMTWKYFGFHVIIYLAGRQGIPKELTEAAQIDGASGWKVFRFVTLPLLGPTIRISVFLSVIGAIQLFDLVWIITEGGPTHSSETMAVTMFEFGFNRFQVGYASAISVVMFLISLVFALAYQRFVLRRDLEGATTVMRDQR
ncbi:sugar ABC transporter permease [Planotetraspora silvatica]|uniref:Sugar ABC transporter permease n=1 Tax=Planotetraspora silvatica TaxID=234614 RepID=A0A8J3UPA5_9ACTN|nr:sugar ABC transporter permease [Planotetraspora silvatica]GII49498.1 sugar ABC transporter permease [Planotetraspora silvatica]